MLNRKIVKIDGFEYIIVTEESVEQVERSAKLVNDEISAIKQATNLSSVKACTLAAMNISDKYFKELDGGDNLRVQVKEYAKDCSQLRSSENDLKHENAKLKAHLERLNTQNDQLNANIAELSAQVDELNARLASNQISFE